MGDLCIIDWYAALLFGEGMEDERAALELASVALLELRLLDNLLDHRIDTAYELASRPLGLWARMRTPNNAVRQVAQMQADGALLFENVSNAHKLLGDQYLARLYRIVARRFYLAEWDAAIARKLSVLESIYDKLAGQADTSRVEALEWIIIVLIAISIAVYFIPGVGSH